jgi:hypothetical protein
MQLSTEIQIEEDFGTDMTMKIIGRRTNEWGHNKFASIRLPHGFF